MFDTTAPSDPGPPHGGTGPPLDARALAGWKDTLALTLEAPSGLDDPARVDAIRSLEELVCVATAAQAALSTELDRSQRQAHADAGVPAARRGAGVGHQVALARRESPHRGRRHLGLAKIVVAELPHTWTAWRTGRITEWKATLVARETACLTREDRLAVDAVVCADADRLEAMGDRELADAVRAEGQRLDPAAHVARRRRAAADRHVSLRPAPDAMSRLSALLPVADGVAVYAALTRAAGSARAHGDDRSSGQVMADTLVAAILEAAAASRAAETAWATGSKVDTKPSTGGAPTRPRTGPAVPIRLGLVMTDTSVFGGGEEPAHVDGYGPIPAELGRELLADALTRGERVWVKRLFTHPDTGELAAMDARGRLFRNSLARFIRLRDRSCRTPWCDAPIRHGDHSEQHATGGPTDVDNGQGLCEACNHAKQAPGWRARPSPDPDGGHVVATTTPTGQRHRSRPPVLATVRETPIRIEYVRAS